MSLFDTAPGAIERGRPLAERMRRSASRTSSGRSTSWAPASRCARRSSGTSFPLSSCGTARRRQDHPGALDRPPDALRFLPFSAVLAGIKEIKAVMADAERNRRLGRRTLLFIDEIHRFNKAQQDAFLPYVERGDIVLIGATMRTPPSR